MTETEKRGAGEALAGVHGEELCGWYQEPYTLQEVEGMIENKWNGVSLDSDEAFRVLKQLERLLTPTTSSPAQE